MSVLKVDWNKYLDKKIINEFHSNNKLTPREILIITEAVQEEIPLERAKLPFHITEYDRKIYKEEKEDYEYRKKLRGGKPSYYSYLNDLN